MPLVGLVFALFTTGYILGVWTACLVFKQPQRAYEEGTLWRAADGVTWRATDSIPVAVSSGRIEAFAGTLRRVERRL